MWVWPRVAVVNNAVEKDLAGLEVFHPTRDGSGQKCPVSYRPHPPPSVLATKPLQILSGTENSALSLLHI